MPKALFTFLIFLLGALAGSVLAAVIALLLGVIALASYRHTHPGTGIGAVAGGVSEASVLLVPILSGIVAVLLAKRSRYNR